MIKTKTPKKRKVVRTEERTRKKASTSSDIKRYTSCKQWKDQERKEKEERG
jgi:hypothetical protein